MGKVINGVECEEVLAPQLVRFEAGDVVEGILLARERVTIQGKPVIQYMLEKTNGVVVKFFGTADLLQKLKPAHVGYFLSIACRGEDKTVKRGENCMKVFDVFASKKPMRADAIAASDGAEITDADIPF